MVRAPHQMERRPKCYAGHVGWRTVYNGTPSTLLGGPSEIAPDRLTVYKGKQTTPEDVPS